MEYTNETFEENHSWEEDTEAFILKNKKRSILLRFENVNSFYLSIFLNILQTFGCEDTTTIHIYRDDNDL